MKNITVILPVHKLDGDYKEMLNKAIESTEDFHNDVKISIVCPENVKKEDINELYVISGVGVREYYKKLGYKTLVIWSK